MREYRADLILHCFHQDRSVKMLSNGMLYYEKSGEGLGAWRSEFCVDDFIFDGATTAAVFSGIKCGSSIYDFLSAEELATAANNGTDLGRTLTDGLGNVASLTPVKHSTKICSFNATLQGSAKVG